MVLNNEEMFENMKRCTKCVLPETFPGIDYDEATVCNYCRDWEGVNVFGEETLVEELSKYKNKGKEYDILAPFSGGRDSAFVLHQIIKKYQMNALSITVDSGFITEEGYRNIDTITKKLNGEHVWIKDEKKVETAKENCKIKFHGWLKQPSINTIVPVLNSGDKTMNLQMFNYAHNKGIPLVMGGNNIGNSVFEQEHWKTGFFGIFPDDRGYYSTNDKIKLTFHFWGEYLQNKSNFKIPILMEYLKGAAVYFFESVIKPTDVDTLGFYDYIYWNEKNILSTITKETEWKGAADTSTTWRVDDLAYPLINYLYYSLVGFTEHDEMYSKMIRDGQITRAEAMKRLSLDHQPRLPSLNKLFEELEVTKQEVDNAVKKYRKVILKKVINDNDLGHMIVETTPVGVIENIPVGREGRIY